MYLNGQSGLVSTDLTLIVHITAFGRFCTLRKVFRVDGTIAETGNRELAGLGAYRYLYNTGRNRELGIGQILVNTLHNLTP